MRRTIQRRTLAEFLSLRYATQAADPTQMFSQRIGAFLAYLAHRLEIGPTWVTLCALLAAVLASLVYAMDPHVLRASLGSLALFQLAHALDCADGQLARATGRASERGAWLDTACDHVRNVVVGLAVTFLLIDRDALPPTLILVGIGIGIAGTVLLLHAGTSLRHSATERIAARLTRGAWPRRIVAAAVDTPVFMLALCVLRPYDAALLFYVAGMGVVHGAMSSASAAIRLRGPQ